MCKQHQNGVTTVSVGLSALSSASVPGTDATTNVNTGNSNRMRSRADCTASPVCVDPTLRCARLIRT